MNVAENPDAEWSQTDWLLYAIEYELRGLLWGMGGGKGEKPKPRPTPGEMAANDRMVESAEQHRASVDDILKDFIS